jgi:diguanylate cyclase (GGDEF)-like protein/PAS domain S-box-containing protein
MTSAPNQQLRLSDWGRQGLTDDVDHSTLFENAFRHAAIGMALLRLDGRWLKVNDALCHIVGYSREELLQLDFQTLTHPADLPSNLDFARRLLDGELTSYHLETRYLRRDGHEVWAILSVTLARSLDGSPRYLISQIQDITARKQAEKAERELRHTKLLLEQTIAHIEDGVVLVDAARNAVLFNRAYSALFDLGERELRGLSRAEFAAHAASLAEDPAAFEREFAELSLDPGVTVAFFTLLKPRRRVLRRSARPIDSEGQRLYLIVWHDVTAEHDRARDQERAAHTDALTRLPNRRAADEALPREVSRADRTQGQLCAVMMDIDHFKRVNDSFGHAVGDRVLRAIAEAIQGQARSADLVARWGGEEFLALLSTDRNGARLFAERVRAAVAALDIPPVGQVTISAGVGEYTGGGSADALLSEADACLYQAKAQGRDRVCG